MKRVTSSPSGTTESAALAETLLRSMERGDVTRLAAELIRIGGVWRYRAVFSSKNAGQLELLSAVSAVAGGLSPSAGRFQKLYNQHLEGVQVHLYLLRRLAYDPA
jgi:hypothetical protein